MSPHTPKKTRAAPAPAPTETPFPERFAALEARLPSATPEAERSPQATRAEVAQELVALDIAWRVTANPKAQRLVRERAAAFLETYR